MNPEQVVRRFTEIVDTGVLPGYPKLGLERDMYADSPAFSSPSGAEIKAFALRVAGSDVMRSVVIIVKGIGEPFGVEIALGGDIGNRVKGRGRIINTRPYLGKPLKSSDLKENPAMYVPGVVTAYFLDLISRQK